MVIAARRKNDRKSKHFQRIEQTWRQRKWIQTVILIRRDFWDLRIPLNRVVMNWVFLSHDSDIGCRLTTDIVRNLIFYRIEKSLIPSDLAEDFQ